jgi:hypothetical protein
MEPALAAGRYKLHGVATSAAGAHYPVRGKLTLETEDQALRQELLPRGIRGSRNAGVKGMLTDGPVSSGTWSAANGRVKFQLLYNAVMPYHYTLDTLRLCGTWALEGE